MLIWNRKFWSLKVGLSGRLPRIERAVAQGLLLTAAFAVSLAAQDSAFRVNVGIAAAKPGDPIDIPLTLSGGDNGGVGSVLVHISVPKNALAYTDVERGLSVELADGEVAANIADDQANSSQAVVEFSAQGSSCINPGILGYLKFNVLGGAEKGDTTLALIDSEVTICEGGAKQAARGDDGKLTIFSLDEEIPAIACFYFSH